MTEQVRFDGRVAIVTGGGSGLGRTYCSSLASLGAKVVVNDLPDDGAPVGKSSSAAEVAALVAAAGGTAVAIGGDVTSKEAMDSLIQQTIDRFGKIDIMMSNAGTGNHAPFDEMSYEQFDRMIRVHVYGSFLSIRAAWPHMVKQGYGRIVTTGSAAVFGIGNQSHYGCAKGGVIGLTKSLSLEGRGQGILVNSIFPFADTPLARKVVAESNRGAETALYTESLAKLYARGAGTELVAPAALWLAHEDCPVTGELIQSGMGIAQRIFWSYGPGYVDLGMNIEAIRDHWAEIVQSDTDSEFPDIDSALHYVIESQTR